MNFLIGQLHLALGKAQTALFVERVESASNIADGPTRHDLTYVEKFGARFVDPRWPPFVKEIWTSAVVEEE